MPVNVNNMSYTQEMSEKVLPGGHWRKVPGKFQMQALTTPCEREQECITGHVTERSSRGPMEEISGNVSTHARSFILIDAGVRDSHCARFNVHSSTLSARRRNIREMSSNGSLEVISRKVQ